MKVLVVSGGTDTIWVASFIEKVLLPMGYEVSVQKNPKESGTFDEQYKNMGVHFVAPYNLPPKLIRKIPKVRVVWERNNRIKALKKCQKFDAVFVISAIPFHLKCAYTVCDSHTKFFTWIIGSDILRASTFAYKRLKKWIDKTNTALVCTSLKLKNAYKDIFSVNEKNLPVVIDFGNSQIPCIDEVLAKGIDNNKMNFLGVDPALTTVCIGYNANPSQQHKKIINSITNLSEHKKKNICLVLPMTYHKEEEYINSVEQKLKETGIKYKLLLNYLDSRQMAELWASTDIFVHGQTTDALSSSVLEAVYSGCEVFNAKWLAYPEFEEWGVNVHEFESFDSLTDMLSKTLDDGFGRNLDNSSIIKEHSSWEVCTRNWKKIIEGYETEKEQRYL